MAKVSGMKVKVYIGELSDGKVLAGQQGATLNRSAETIDATSKDTEGFWKETLQGFKEWSIDCDGAFVESDAAYNELEAAFLGSENVPVYIEFPSGTKYSGSATITDFPIEAPFDDLVKYSLSLQGSGVLTKTAGPAE
jgi:TP901-1 family phage major tail protein